MGEVLLDIILLLVLSRAFWKLLGGVMAGMNTPRAPRVPEHGVQMVRDPVCGTFIVPERAVALSAEGGQRLYFCSTDCRDKYRARPESHPEPAHGRTA